MRKGHCTDEREALETAEHSEVVSRMPIIRASSSSVERLIRPPATPVGDIAQLVERSIRIAEVVGSIPTISTSRSNWRAGRDSFQGR